MWHHYFTLTFLLLHFLAVNHPFTHIPTCPQWFYLSMWWVDGSLHKAMCISHARSSHVYPHHHHHTLHGCSPLAVSVIRGEVAMVTVIFSSSFLSSPYLSLTIASINSLQLLSFAAVLHSPPTLSRSLLTQSSAFLVSVFPPLSGHLLSAIFPSRILSTCLAHFSLLLTSFFLKLSFTPNSTLCWPCLLLPTLFTPHFVLSSCFCKLALSPIVSL